MHFVRSANFAVAVAALLTAALLAAYFTLEPQVSRSQVQSNSFTISQTIGDEISFLVQPASATTSQTINGLTGGNATATTYAVVRSNSATGFTMSIAFDNQLESMRGETTGSQAIRDFRDGGEPSFLFAASSSSLFGYSATTSTASDLDQSFLDDGGSCNAGSNMTADRCFKGPDTTNFQVVDRGTSAPTGATTTFTFVVKVPNSPTPTVDSDVYTATATLTATNQ